MPLRHLNPDTSRNRACAGPVRGCDPDFFSLRLPAGNLFDLPAGRYAPAVADGYYVFLKPLSRGWHTITFGGTGYLNGEFSINVTYHLRVS